jgi:hypothetical protein
VKWWPFNRGAKTAPQAGKDRIDDEPARGHIFVPKANMSLVEIAGGAEKVLSMIELKVTLMQCQTERGPFWVCQDDRSKRMVIDRELPMAALFIIDDMVDRSILNDGKPQG